MRANGQLYLRELLAGTTLCHLKYLSEEQCHLNFCLKHRHPLDHDCNTSEQPETSLSKPGHAAILRAQGTSKSSAKAPTSRAMPNARANGLNSPARSNDSEMQRTPPRPVPSAASVHGGLTEEQALQRALEMSLSESSRTSPPSLSPQEQEDLALAQAIAASEEEFRRQAQQTPQRNSRSLPCKLS
ncbi:AN1-type zinc finger protein 2B [Callorhinchus milii]|uniref:AN1-type zinc finger protein 2B n=1 Tax=Callorhinchus milii TaxID=7868 RepID=UPI001C3FB56C|nr:AN1-type zinc finger protein 2B [Callorhinchus milii]